MTEANTNITNTNTNGDSNTNTTNTEKLFTQAELDKIIESRLAKEKKRAEKEKAEAEKLAAMNEAEKQRYEFEKKQKELDNKIAEYNKKELTQESVNILTEKGYSVQTARELANFLDYKDADTCKKSIDTLDKVLKACVDREVNNKIKGNTTPKVTTTKNNGITWDDVLKNPNLMDTYLSKK